jgi:tetratricopeptide (TPR) repeat protein
MAQAYGNLGNLNASKGLYRQAESYYQQSMIIMEQIDDKYGLARAYNNPAVLSYEQSRTGEGEALLRQALALFEQLQAPEVATVQEWLLSSRSGSPYQTKTASEASSDC